MPLNKRVTGDYKGVSVMEKQTPEAFKANKLRNYRKKSGISLQGAAIMACVSVFCIANYEMRLPVSVRAIKKIEKAFDI